MPKKLSAVVTIAILTCFTLARADTVASVAAVSQPVWIQIGDLASELDRSNDITLGDRVFTGAGGRAEILLWSGMTLRLYPDSEIVMQVPGDTADTATNTITELYLRHGRLCLQSGPPTSSARNFRMNMDGGLLVTIQQSAHVCADLRDGQSRLGLLTGSVQLHNQIEPSIVILSESGSEFSLNEDGSYRLLPPSSNERIASYDEQPFITTVETSIETEPKEDTAPASVAVTETSSPESSSADTSPAENGVAETSSAAAADTDSSPYIYTVYLFSTRSEEGATEFEQELLGAGHDAQIIATTKDSVTRYRVAVSGFTSRQAAREYSDSIVGSFGIRDTWIGRDRNTGSN